MSAHNRVALPGRVQTPRLSLLLTRPGGMAQLTRMLAALPPVVDEVVVVGSPESDVTRVQLDTLSRPTTVPDVRIVIEDRAGRGNWLRAGLAASSGELVVAMDADGRMSPAEIPQLVYFLEQGFDLVRGSRFVAGGACVGLGAWQRAGKRAVLGLANRWFDLQLSDLCYGYFAVRRHFLDHLELRAEGDEIDAEIAARAAVAGLRIAEVPSRERARSHPPERRQFVDEHRRALETLMLLRREHKLGNRGRPARVARSDASGSPRVAGSTQIAGSTRVAGSTQDGGSTQVGGDTLAGDGAPAKLLVEEAAPAAPPALGEDTDAWRLSTRPAAARADAEGGAATGARR